MSMKKTWLVIFEKEYEDEQRKVYIIGADLTYVQEIFDKEFDVPGDPAELISAEYIGEGLCSCD